MSLSPFYITAFSALALHHLPPCGDGGSQNGMMERGYQPSHLPFLPPEESAGKGVRMEGLSC